MLFVGAAAGEIHQLPGVIRRLELKPNSEQKVEHIFVAPPYCQAPSYVYNSINSVDKEQ